MKTFCNKKAVPMLFILSLLFFPAVSFAEYVGSFSRIEGRVDLLRAGATTVVPARRGDGVSTGDIIRTKSDGRAEILFKDDTTVTVASETRLKIDEYTFNPDNSRSKGMLSLLRGKIRAAVSKVKAGLIPVSLGSSTFSVNTPTSVAGVRGTVFFVFFDKGVTGVIFREGNGFVYNQNMPDKIVNVSAGQATFILADDAPPLPPRPATEAEMSRHLIDTTIDGGQTDNGTTDSSVFLDQPVGGDVSGYNAPKTADTGVDPGPPPPVLPITETDTGTLKETVPPLITITSSPPAITNSSSGSFTITFNEPVTATYSMGNWGTTVANTTSDTFSIDQLPEGNYTLTITATDAAGNVSTSSYAWITDYTAPASLALTGTPAAITNINTATIGATATDANGVTYSYTLDGAASTGTITGLTEGLHTFVVTATDAAGNVSTSSYSWTTDYTAPVTTFTSSPGTLTNISTANFGVSSSETSTYTYKLDGTTVASTNLTAITEGPHTFTVTATDAAGNVSTSSYAWTTDYTAPVVTYAASPDPSLTSPLGIISFTGNDPSAAYSYDIDGVTSTSQTISFTGIAEGSHTLSYTATDAAGNSSTETLTFDLSRYSLSGNFWGCIGEVTGTVSGDVAGISGQNWGGWNIGMTGTGNLTPNPTWTLYAGGTSSDATFVDGRNNGYWIEVAPGSSDYGNKTLTGTSTFRYLSYDRLGIGTGSLTGTYRVNVEWYDYELIDTGNGTYTETPLAWSGRIGNDYYGNGLYNNGDGILGVGDTYGGLAGGTQSPWSGTTSLTLMGPYYSWYAAPYLWNAPIYSYNVINANNTTYDGGAFWGLTGGMWWDSDNLSTTAGDRNIDARIYSIYIDPSGNAGILKGSLTGEYYPELSMFEADGTWTPTILATGLDPTTLGSLTSSPDLTWQTFGGSGAGSFTAGSISEGQTKGFGYSISGQDWGIWQALTAGGYSGTSSDTWNFSFNYVHYLNNFTVGTQTDGSQWSNGVLAGQTYGYGADITTTPKTWISVGETIGTFDTTMWQAVQTGAWLDTNRFLTMTQTPADQAKLAALNIPFVEVGKANLSGSGTMGGAPINVNMTDVTFFAYSNGDAPKIWATGNVSGDYGCSACGVATVGLTSTSGGSLSANFNVQNFDTSGKKWIATVDGSGTLSGGSYSGPTTFNGAAAGTNSGTIGGTFSGTGAGVAQ